MNVRSAVGVSAGRRRHVRSRLTGGRRDGGAPRVYIRSTRTAATARERSCRTLRRRAAAIVHRRTDVVCRVTLAYTYVHPIRTTRVRSTSEAHARTLVPRDDDCSTAADDRLLQYTRAPAQLARRFPPRTSHVRFSDFFFPDSFPSRCDRIPGRQDAGK